MRRKEDGMGRKGVGKWGKGGGGGEERSALVGDAFGIWALGWAPPLLVLLGRATSQREHPAGEALRCPPGGPRETCP